MTHTLHRSCAQIANAVNIKQAVHAAKSVSVIVLINYHSLKADRGRGIRDLKTILSDLFGGADRFVAQSSSVALCVSRAPRMDGDGDDIELGELVGLVINEEEEDKMISALEGNIFCYSPVGKAPESWFSREEIINMVRNMEGIEEPYNVFQTVLNLDDERELREITGAMGDKVQDLMLTYDYSEAAKVLDRLVLLERIDNARVTRLVLGGCFGFGGVGFGGGEIETVVERKGYGWERERETGTETKRYLKGRGREML